MKKHGFYSILESTRIIFESDQFFIATDGFPVSKGHLLIISKRIVSDYFELSEIEHVELAELIVKAKNIIDSENSPSGYNIGMNCGQAAGQTVMHFHCHIIPRYEGDVEDPRGGIRNCIPTKGNYFK